MKHLLLLCLVIKSFPLSAQQSPNIIQINDSLTAHRYEFSSLAKWKNKIVLIPQNHRNVIDSVYMIDSAEIERSVQKNSVTKFTAFAIKNLKHAGPRKDSLYINHLLLPNYDGIEGTVIKGDTIFFSLETTATFCYVIKGIINEKEKVINMLTDTLHIPNTYDINNAGYESLALLPKKDSLLAFFECNKDVAHARAYMISTSLKGKPKPVEWERPLYFRITDVFALNDSVLIGINRLFTVPFYTKERDDYLKNTDTAQVNKQFTNGGNPDLCFDQLIKLTIKHNKINWQPLAFVSLNLLDNYEGLVPFKDGVLMVVDGEPGNVPCKLVYMRLK